MQKSALIRTPWAAGLGLALAGCAVGPNYREPAPAAPVAWSAPLPHGGAVGSLDAWWAQFDDPLVARLVAMAEADSPSLAKAWANIEKARATLVSARADGLPTLTGGSSITRSKQQILPGSETTSSTRSGELDASWEIDLFGKVRRTTEAARALVGARVSDWHDTRVSLAAEVADTYVEYRGCAQLADAYERELQSETQTEQATASLVRAGFKSPSDGALARAGTADTRSTLVSQRGQCELLVKSLVNLTGSDEAQLRALLVMGDGHLPQPAMLAVESVPAQVLRQRPDLASLERQVAAASADIGVAQADLYPSLSLSGSISVSASNSTRPATGWSLGPSLSIPIFNGGSRRAAVKSAYASYAVALADYRQGVRDAVKEVEQALVNLDSTDRRAADAATADDEYRRYFLATEKSWRAGRETLLTLEEARRSALSAEVQRITLQRDRVAYWIALYKALGGGWAPDSPAQPPTAALPASPTNKPWSAS
jgi:NodT family efflux transporter outer membrane factor (OMF) lipoprotein